MFSCCCFENGLDPSSEHIVITEEEDEENDTAAPQRERVGTEVIREWTVQVHRVSSSVRWGLTIDALYQHRIIVSVSEDGAVAAANASAPKGEEIRPGDLI